MNFQHGLSNFILQDDASHLNVLFEDGTDMTIASIYRNGFFRSCREVLASTYVSVVHIVGDELFKTLAHAFIKTYPPNTGTLTGYGKQFSEWLAVQTIEHRTLIVEAAKLDWAWLACLHGADGIPLTAKIFQSYTCGGVSSALPTICILPNVQLVLSNNAAFNLWLYLKGASDSRETDGREIDDLDMDEQQSILMWRPTLEVFTRALSINEALFVAEIVRHKDINIASDNLLKTCHNFDLSEQFAALLQNGVLQISGE